MYIPRGMTIPSIVCKGSAQAIQAALAHTMAQCNPTVKRGLAKQPKTKPISKRKASDKMTQMKKEDMSH